jgi:hypothetical protein
MNERTGNVSENKGPDIYRSAASGNLIESKTTYWLMAGILLKTKAKLDVKCKAPSVA